MECNSNCIYLSPSAQQFNLYNGPGNEEEYMNIVADSVAKYLTELGFCFKRNSPDMTVGDIVADSNSGDYFLHLSIHSNAAGEGSSGEVRGSEAYYYPTSQKGSLFARIIANNMKKIYPLPENVFVKTSSSFAELKRTKAPSVLVEVAYHDNEDDAQWIRTNTDEIGRALALSVKEYYDEVCACPRGKRGEVITMGGNLNVRTLPDISSDIVAKLPNGSPVDVTDCSGRWYKIKAEAVEGYVFKHYVSI